MKQRLAIAAILLLLLCVNSFAPPGFFARKTGIAIEFWLWGVVAVAVLGRVFFSSTNVHTAVKTVFLAVVLCFLPVMTGVSLFAYWAEEAFFTNYFFSTFRVHPDQLALVPLFTFVWAVTQLPKNWLWPYKKWVVFLIPLYVFLVSLVLRMRFFGVFQFLNNEDSVLEYLTFGLFLMTAWFSGKACLKLVRFRKVQQFEEWMLLLFFGLITLVSVLVAGEEISWGQRLFGIETPEEYKQLNHQQELNIHNYQGVFEYVYRGYYFLGLYGTTGWIIRLFVNKKTSIKWLKRWANTIIPDWYLALYFLPSTIYVRLRRIYGIWKFANWEELMEVALVVGIFLFVWESTKDVRTRFEKKQMTV